MTSLVTLTDSLTGSRAIISPIGASLLELELSGIKVVEQVKNSRTDLYSGVVMAPWSSRIAGGKYSLPDGRSFQVPINEPARNNALHGVVYDQNFEIKRLSESSVELAIEISGFEGYPFVLKLAVSYELEDGELFASFAVRNTSSEKAPFGIGFHPYFSCAWFVEPMQIQNDAASYFELDENLISLGKTKTAASDKDLSLGKKALGASLDDGYTDLVFDHGISSTKLIDSNGRGVQIWQENIFKHAVIFTTDNFETEAGPISAVAVEPSTSAVNAFNSNQDLIWLEPNQTRSGSWGIKLLQ